MVPLSVIFLQIFLYIFRKTYTSLKSGFENFWTFWWNFRGFLGNFRGFYEARKRIFLLRELQLSKKFRAARAYSPASTHNDIDNDIVLSLPDYEKSCLL